MNDMELEIAVRAARAKAPKGMGDFALREVVLAALKAAEEFRNRPNVNRVPA